MNKFVRIIFELVYDIIYEWEVYFGGQLRSIGFCCYKERSDLFI